MLSQVACDLDASSSYACLTQRSSMIRSTSRFSRLSSFMKFDVKDVECDSIVLLMCWQSIAFWCSNSFSIWATWTLNCAHRCSSSCACWLNIACSINRKSALSSSFACFSWWASWSYFAISSYRGGSLVKSVWICCEMLKCYVLPLSLLQMTRKTTIT